MDVAECEAIVIGQIVVYANEFSRHVVGVDTIELTAGKPPAVVLGSGMRAKNAAPVAVGVTWKLVT